MAKFIVNTTLDELDGSILDGDVSLRDAVAAANDTAGADTICFDPAVFNGEAADILRLTQGQIAITDMLVINGGAGVTITGDANGNDVTLAGGITDVVPSRNEGRLEDNSRIFEAGADLTLDGLTLTGGKVEDGGAVRAGGTLTLIDSTVSGNYAQSSGGGIYGGTVNVTKSTISGNFGYNVGGGILGGTVTITDSTVTDNDIVFYGGGVFGSTVIVTNSTISDNDARYSGGGIVGNTVTVTDTTVTNNNSGVEGGGIYGFYGGTVTVMNSTVSGNGGGFAGGGGISGDTVTVTNSTIDGNDAQDGGGIIGAAVNVTNSTVSGNTAYFGVGGGISGDTVTVTKSTISGNYGNGGGGGISGNAVDVTNSTISGNYGGYYGGGGISGNAVSLTNSTVSGNTSSVGGGILGNATVALTNSIVLGNAVEVGDEVQATALVRTGGNILGGDVFSGDTDIGDTSAPAVFAATAEIAPGVLAGVLANNGGPTQTIALKLDQGNPAIGGADPATATPTDQRGVPRGADPDLGAFEAEQVGPPAAFRIEAETLHLVSAFRLGHVAAASGDVVITSPNPKIEAHARFTFAGDDGHYDLDLGYFDEKDGKSRLAVFIDGLGVDRFRFKEHIDSSQANAETRAERHIAGVEIKTGDVIELVGHSNRDEPLRIDYLDFTYVDDLIT